VFPAHVNILRHFRTHILPRFYCELCFIAHYVCTQKFKLFILHIVLFYNIFFISFETAANHVENVYWNRLQFVELHHFVVGCCSSTFNFKTALVMSKVAQFMISNSVFAMGLLINERKKTQYVETSFENLVYFTHSV
jgi:hypothetical protein